MTIKIAFYKSEFGDWQDKAISFVSASIYSHCEIVFQDGTCASSSARDGGIRFKKIELGNHWDVYDIVTDVDVAAIKYWFNLNIDDTYDWLGALGSSVHIDLTTEGRKFCSYACAIVLGVSPIRTPGNLYRTLAKENMIRATQH
jgi:hypothetical protein